LVDTFITQLLRWWLVHVVLIWLFSRHLSMISIKSNAVYFQRGVSHWWSIETVCSHDLNSVMTLCLTFAWRQKQSILSHHLCI